MSSVRTPGSGENAAILARVRTSARVTRRRCPVARSISSADSSSSRCTAAPTVPYPRSATGTSTDATSLPVPGAVHQAAELLADGLELRLRRLGAHRLEPGLVVVHVLDPLAGERTGLDVGQDALHLLAHVLVDRRACRACSRRTRPCPRSSSACRRGRSPTSGRRSASARGGTRSRRSRVRSRPRRASRSPARTSSEVPPQRTACSPKRSVSVSSLNVVSRMPGAAGADPDGVGEREVARACPTRPAGSRSGPACRSPR